MTIENESKRPLDGSLKWGGNTYKFGYNTGYKRGQRILDHIDFVKEVIVTGTDKGIEAEIYLDPDVPDAQQRIHSAITALNQKTVSTKRIDHIRLRNTEFPKTTTKKIKRTAVKTESNM